MDPPDEMREDKQREPGAETMDARHDLRPEHGDHRDDKAEVRGVRHQE